MATPFVQNWIIETQLQYDYWYNNYLTLPGSFIISPLPGLPKINTNILSHNISSCCPTPGYPNISFEHFPEPYYGNPDDVITKLAVVLFFNPGKAGDDQLLTRTGPNTFHSHYISHKMNYQSLASSFDFCKGTVDKFIKTKTNQLNNLLGCILPKTSENDPLLFMDLIPWHSDTFNGIDNNRFNLPDTISEVKKKFIIPAILNAENTLITQYLQSLRNGTNKIVIFSVGAKYSRDGILQKTGFTDITKTIPVFLPYTIITSNEDICIDCKAKAKVWKANGTDITRNLNLDSRFDDMVEKISHKEIFVINMWTKAQSMDIPKNICSTINHIMLHI